MNELSCCDDKGFCCCAYAIGVAASPNISAALATIKACLCMGALLEESDRSLSRDRVEVGTLFRRPGGRSGQDAFVLATHLHYFVGLLVPAELEPLELPEPEFDGMAVTSTRECGLIIICVAWPSLSFALTRNEPGVMSHPASVSLYGRHVGAGRARPGCLSVAAEPELPFSRGGLDQAAYPGRERVEGVGNELSSMGARPPK